MSRVNVIRHLAFEDLGCFADVFEEKGYQISYHEAGVDDLSVLRGSHDLLVILGGPISANDTDIFPFLDEEIAILIERIEQDLPTLGICLGAQLIARAAGADVFPGVAKEIGWMPLHLTEAGMASPLSELEQCDGVVLHWHGETFDLPEGASCLASTDVTPNQAFMLGRHILGFQFHVEATEVAMEKWYIGHIGEISQSEGVSVPRLRHQAAGTAQATERAGRAFLARWLEAIPT